MEKKSDLIYVFLGRNSAHEESYYQELQLHKIHFSLSLPLLSPSLTNPLHFPQICQRFELSKLFNKVTT